MSKTPIDQLIPRADKHIVRAFPRVAQRLENSVDEMDRAEMETFLKILPGAIERFQAVVTPRNDLHESVEVAIMQLVAGFPRQSFVPSNALTVESASQFETETPQVESNETVTGVIGAELPNGSDTSQQIEADSLSRNEPADSAGNTGESDSPQERPRNARVRKRPPFSGRRSIVRSRWAPGESGNDQG